MTITGLRRLFAFVVLLILSGATHAAEVPLIPRRVLFGNPERQSVMISPDGKYISYLAPANGVMNVWVAPADKLDGARPITNDRNRGIRQYFWAYTSRQVLYAQDRAGDENWNVFCADVSAEQPQDTKNLTPNPAVQARIERVSHKFPDEIVVGLNDRDPKSHDIHRINIHTGADRLIVKNPGEIENCPVESLVIDDDYRVRVAFATTKGAGYRVYTPRGDGPEPAWNLADAVAMEDALSIQPMGFDKSGKTIYLADSRGRDTAALVKVDTEDGTKTGITEDDRADVTDVLLHPTEKNVQAASFNFTRKQWKVVDPAVREDFEVLKGVVDGDISVTSRTLDDKTWIVQYMIDAGPMRYYRYDRPTRTATFLFSHRPALDKLPLAPMYPQVIKSRDGLNLVSYLTLPVESDDAVAPTSASPRAGARDQAPKPGKALPMVLLVHGGPYGRDEWEFNAAYQWLANRGYAVLSVNYRGSTGFGKEFVNASNREWGGKMHDDLIDAVKWAVDHGYADKDKVAIMGGSYGGYATLVGMTFTPEAFACGVDIVGPSNLTTFLSSIPPYWESGRAMWRTRMGDESTPEGLKFLQSRSPMMFVDRIKRPLLIGHGKNDPRVKEAESAQIVKTMQDKNLPVTYVYFSDEGHGFGRPENKLSFYAVAEQFLAAHLGGRAEPIGDDFRGSTIEVKAGAENVKGLAAALKGR